MSDVNPYEPPQELTVDAKPTQVSTKTYVIFCVCYVFLVPLAQTAAMFMWGSIIKWLLPDIPLDLRQVCLFLYGVVWIGAVLEVTAHTIYILWSGKDFHEL